MFGSCLTAQDEWQVQMQINCNCHMMFNSGDFSISKIRYAILFRNTGEFHVKVKCIYVSKWSINL